MFCRQISHPLLDFSKRTTEVRKNHFYLTKKKKAQSIFVKLAHQTAEFHRKHKLSPQWSSRETALLSSPADALGSGAPTKVSTHHPVPSRVTDSGHHFVPTTVGPANTTVGTMCCMAWFILTCLASRVLTAKHFKWVISESQLGVLSEALVCRYPNKTLHKHWAKGLPRLYRHRDDLLSSENVYFMCFMSS